jgi:hypothetical protein
LCHRPRGTASIGLLDRPYSDLRTKDVAKFDVDITITADDDADPDA